MPNGDIKPGYQTTEFWQTLLVNVIALLALFGVHITASNDFINAIAVIAALLASAIVTHGYTLGRSRVKAARLQAPSHPASDTPESAATSRVLPAV
jgi:hypothetical protein